MVILFIHAMAFKRKRVYAPRRGGFKKKRTFRKRMIKRGGKTVADFTSNALRGTTVGFRGKKTSRRAFRKHLWDSTLFKAHYRSLAVNSSNVATPANVTDAAIFGLNAYRLGAVPFWTAAGGALPIDAGVPVPVFGGDIILRGGVYSVTFYNPGPSDVRIVIWKTFTVADPNLALLPALSVVGWDPSVTADFTAQIAKPTWNKSVIIDVGSSYTLSDRFKIQKIDENTYGAEGRSPIYFCALSNVGSAISSLVNITRSYNLSFSADEH